VRERDRLRSPFYSLRHFRCKIAQFCATQREFSKYCHQKRLANTYKFVMILVSGNCAVDEVETAARWSGLRLLSRPIQIALSNSKNAFSFSIRAPNETLSVVLMRVSNPDCPDLRINS